MQSKNKKEEGSYEPKSKKSNVQTDEQYYDNADLKKMFNTSDSTLYRMRKEGVLPFYKPRGKIYYPKSFFNKTVIEKCMRSLSRFVE